MEPNQTDKLASDLGNIARQLNGFVRYLKQQKRQTGSKKLKEESATYETESIQFVTEDEIIWLENTDPRLQLVELANLQSLIFNQPGISND